MKILSQGAEAIIYKKENYLVKERIKKGYRLPEIDSKLRKNRTKKEVKLINESRRNLVNVPSILNVDYKEDKIEMEFIEGAVLKNILSGSKDREKICKDIGKQLARLHQADIVHGDLTTSNLILHNKRIFFIDFGLAERSARIEDKAVDLHLFKQALQSKHSKIAEDCFKHFKKGYMDYKNSKKVFERLTKIEKRGRYFKR